MSSPLSSRIWYETLFWLIEPLLGQSFFQHAGRVQGANGKQRDRRRKLAG
jgi:hypothetical protein